eukprot:EG_transcript_41146
MFAFTQNLVALPAFRDAEASKTIRHQEWMQRTRAQGYAEAEKPMEAVRLQVQEAVVRECDARDALWRVKQQCPAVQLTRRPEGEDACYEQLRQAADRLQQETKAVDGLAAQPREILKATIEAVRARHPYDSPEWPDVLPKLKPADLTNYAG